MQIIVRRMTLTDLILNVFFKIRFWFYRNFYRRKLRNFSTTTNKPGFELTFEDDFGDISWSGDGKGTKWRWGEGWGQFHPDNPTSYSGEPILHSGESCAVFIARYNPKTFPDDHRTGKPITIPIEKSLLSTTDESLAQQYGRFECRCTLPMAKGSWPAFWGWTQREMPGEFTEDLKPFKYYTEIDCCEWYGRDDGRDVIKQEINFHWKTTPGDWNHCFPWKVKIEKPKYAQERFHEYAFEWRQDRIEMFTDGVKIFRFTRKDVLDKYYNRETARLWIIINAGIDGKIVTDADQEYFSSFKVDYIRAYKLEE